MGSRVTVSGHKRLWQRSVLLFSTPLAAILIASCQANPGEAPTVEEAQTTEAASARPTAPPEQGDLQLHVGVGPFSGNLNPHLVGNVSPLVMGIADLTLPSVFLQRGADLVENPDVVTKVSPDSSTAPTEVTYTLNSAAQWSDGTPVTISDFRYLHQQIIGDKSASESAAYSRIKSIEPGKSGSIVVKFDQPFSGWKELFHHLLPSHIYGAENQSFATMMDGKAAASGGAYTVTSLDDGRGKLELRRNDRYWGKTPAATDRLIFDRMPDLSTSMQMLRTGQIEMMISQPSEITTLALESIPGVQHRTVERQVDLNFTLNTHSATMAVADQRAKIMGALDPRRIAQIATESTQTELPADPAVEAIAVRGEGAANTEPADSKPGRQIGNLDDDGAFVIGAPTESPQAIAAARVAADQLNSKGITTQVVTKDATELLTSDLPNGTIDALVNWQKTPESAADYYNQFSCTSEGSHSESSAKSTDKEALTATAGNVTGFCGEELNATLAGVVQGKTTIDAQRDTIARHVAEANIMVPLVRDAQVVATGSAIEGPEANVADWATDPLSGVLPTARDWKKVTDSQDSAPLEGEDK